ncbi:hypothetical protein Heshes_11290 [Alicyclobacillus hesperidum]|uniref:EamA domain-containing protein n=1 Tax=Alicyclobacillus hesperidum TaxID=89784 RepID=A0AA37X2X8_9BACL|nr:hypothetical protein Heshes_11290 [Alicyclobacillus hesperidum]
MRVGFLAALGSAICYALSYCFLRKGQAESSPPDYGLLPILAMSAISLSGVAIIEYMVGGRLIKPGADLPVPVLWATCSGIVGTFLGRMLLYRAVNQLGAVRGVVLKGVSPVATMAVAAFALGEDPSFDDGLGLCGVLGSILLLVIESRLRKHRAARFAFQSAAVIGITAACIQGVGHVFRQLSVQTGLSPLPAAAIDLSAATSTYVIWLLCRGTLLALLRWYAQHLNIWLAVAGWCSAAGVFLFFFAADHASVSTVAILAASEPVFVALFSALFLARLERLSWWSGAAALLIGLSAMMLVTS